MVKVEIIPAILEIDKDSIEQKLRAVAAYVSWVHIDVFDGSLSSRKTVVEAEYYAGLIRQYPDCSFEAHLFVANPEKYIGPFADAGFSRLIAHVESNDPRRFLHEAQYNEVEVCIAIDGATEVHEVEPFLEEIDGVVVVMKELGVENGIFLPEAVERIKLIRQNYPDLPITAAGGINNDTVKLIREAGATRLVVGTYIFGNSGQEKDAIETLS